MSKLIYKTQDLKAVFRTAVLCFGWMFVSVIVFSQNVFILEGRVNESRGSAISNAHVVNRTLRYGVTTDLDGKFRIMAETGDSVLFTHMGYKPFWFQVPKNEEVNGKMVYIALLSDTIYLEEAIVRPFPATFKEFKEVVAKLDLPKEKKPTMFDPVSGSVYSPEGGIVITGPISALYAIFSKEAKQIRKMNEINHFENVRSVLYSKVSKDIIYKIFDVKSEFELEYFLHQCNLSDDFVYSASAIEILEQLNLCYAQIKQEKRN
ncbi:MAG: hypothetical protein RBS19_06400 [Bacteroidales bacterium]|nr:hypothetical protein [Bacteroidales bacterium]